MMLGKRGRPPFRRTTSMTGLTAVDVGNMAAPPQIPRDQKTVTGGEFNVYDPMLSQGYDIETADFLRTCGLCNRRLALGRDIYMYRGDTAFCTLECREQQMEQDERKERLTASTAKHAEGHRRFELAVAVTETSCKTKSLTSA